MDKPRPKEKEQMFKIKTYKSSFSKRMELINAILDSDYTGCAEEWLEERNIDLTVLTDNEIDKLIWVVKEST